MGVTTNNLELYNRHVKTNPTKPTPIKYKVKSTKTWRKNPITTPPTPCDNATPLVDIFYHTNTPYYNPQPCIYIDGSLIATNEHVIGNISNLAAYNPNNDLCIVERLSGLPTILRAELYAQFIALTITKDQLLNTFHIYQQPQ